MEVLAELSVERRLTYCESISTGQMSKPVRGSYLESPRDADTHTHVVQNDVLQWKRKG